MGSVELMVQVPRVPAGHPWLYSFARVRGLKKKLFSQVEQSRAMTRSQNFPPLDNVRLRIE
jgi:hypothetical protein